jgi:fumarate hydratase class II
LKKAYAIVNERYGIDKEIANAIKRASDDILNDKLNNQITLSIYRTISGIQTNVHVNEVIANRAIQILGIMGSNTCVHPIDHLNKNQCSNHTFSTGKE